MMYSSLRVGDRVLVTGRRWYGMVGTVTEVQRNGYTWVDFGPGHGQASWRDVGYLPSELTPYVGAEA
jgi:hypothetical protein